MNEADEKIIKEILEWIDQEFLEWSNTVKVGDMVDASEDGFYTFSKHQYKTKGKLYQVQEVDVRTDDTGEVYCCTVKVHGDYQDPTSKDPEIVWLGPSKVIIRNGEVIWESGLVKASLVLLNSDEVLDEEQRGLLTSIINR